MTLFQGNCTTHQIFFLIANLKSKLLYTEEIPYFACFQNLKSYIFIFFTQILIHFLQCKFNLILLTKANEKLKLLTLFLLYSIFVKHCFLTQFKNRCKLIPILRFCYFFEKILSLKSYYHSFYVFVAYYCPYFDTITIHFTNINIIS